MLSLRRLSIVVPLCAGLNCGGDSARQPDEQLGGGHVAENDTGAPRQSPVAGSGQRTESGETLDHASVLLCMYEVEAGEECPLYAASLLQLITRPEVFDGKRVQVVGFVHLEFEGNGLYVHREDYERFIGRNGLWLDFGRETEPRQECQDRYVLIEGTFDAGFHGHQRLWSGAITDITRCQPLRMRRLTGK